MRSRDESAAWRGECGNSSAKVMSRKDWRCSMTPGPGGICRPAPGLGTVDTGDLPPLVGVYGAVPAASGGYVIPELTARLGGPILHHGPILVTLEAAAIEAAGPDVRAAALSVRIVKAGKRAPFVASATVMSEDAGLVVVRAELTQDGDPTNVVATATFTLRRDPISEESSR